MHELYIAECVLKTVAASLPAGISVGDVVQVRVKVGQLDAVCSDSLRFLFDAIKATHGMPRAELHIEEEPVHCRCHTCAHEFSLDLPVFVCPACGGGNVAILRGRGVTLIGLSVTDKTENSLGDTHRS